MVGEIDAVAAPLEILDCASWVNPPKGIFVNLFPSPWNEPLNEPLNRAVPSKSPLKSAVPTKLPVKFALPWNEPLNEPLPCPAIILSVSIKPALNSLPVKVSPVKSWPM